MSWTGLFVGCLSSQPPACVSQEQICSDKFTCCHAEIEAADQTLYLTQSQYTDTVPTGSSTDPMTPGAWQGSHWSANFYVTGMTWPGKIPMVQAWIEPWIFCSWADALTTRPTRRSMDRWIPATQTDPACTGSIFLPSATDSCAGEICSVDAANPAIR